MTQIVDALPPVAPELRTRIETGPRSVASHKALMADTPAMHLLEIGGAGQGALPVGFTVTAWNAERCLFPQAAATFLAQDAPALILLSEMDNGMARTGQRNTTAELAQSLGMAYVYGVEFYELGLGGPTEAQFCTDDHNALGFHGNAILSAAPFTRVKLIRLPQEGWWFDPEGAGNLHEPRIGTRMAIAAEIPTEAGPICAVVTHLESNADVGYRARQMQVLMDAVDEFAPGLPVVIGGDLNTGNHMPPDFDWRGESLFEDAQGRGYDWSGTPDGITTRSSLISPHITRQMKLDWIAVRGVSARSRPLRDPLDPDGTPLADHLPVSAEVAI